jgi:hypothetical protein
VRLRSRRHFHTAGLLKGIQIVTQAGFLNLPRGAEVKLSPTSAVDDTALMSADVPFLQLKMNALISQASRYGLEPNWDKTIHLQVRHNETMHTPAGAEIKPASTAVHLGSLLVADGTTKSSVGRRLGEARSVLNDLQAVWKHANVTKRRKIQIFNDCVLSKLLYRQADPTQIRCLPSACSATDYARTTFNAVARLR